jgi:hypothetical protein
VSRSGAATEKGVPMSKLMATAVAVVLTVVSVGAVTQAQADGVARKAAPVRATAAYHPPQTYGCPYYQRYADYPASPNDPTGQSTFRSPAYASQRYTACWSYMYPQMLRTYGFYPLHEGRPARR